jgi:hypothetical protein
LEADAKAAKKTTESFENCIVVVGYFLILGYQIRLRYLEIRDAGRVDLINAVLKSEDKQKSIPRKCQRFPEGVTWVGLRRENVYERRNECLKN